MRAIQLSSPSSLDGLTVVDVPEPPAPGPGEVLVRVRASSLNYKDYGIATGMAPAIEGRVPMSDGAGDVLAVGVGVSEFRVGDRVVSTFYPDWLDGKAPREAFIKVPGDTVDGFAREQALVAATAITHVPEGYSHAEAATLTCAGLTAWRALVVDGPLMAGETVLVMGSGGVSVFALQLARAFGAKVIATSSSDEKLGRLRSLGADQVINYRRVQDWGSAARKLTGGRGVDHVVEIGGMGTLAQSCLATREWGHIALVGGRAGREGSLPMKSLVLNQLRIQGLSVGSRRHQLDLIRAISSTGIKPVIDSSFALTDIAEAFRYQASGRHLGKIVLEI